MKIIRNNKVFDMTRLGKIVAENRRRENLTQSELAEALGVTHQAISSWENGYTSPDISKLSDLAFILKVTVDELIGNTEMMEAVNKVENGEVLSETELVDIAPITKPSTFKVLTDKIGIRNFSVRSIAEIAPFVEEELLIQWMEAYEGNLEIKDITPIAPFLSVETLDTMIDKVSSNNEVSVHDIMPIIPFVSENKVHSIVDKIVEVHQIEDLVALAPFIKEEDLSRLVNDLLSKEDVNISEIAPLAPFLDKETIHQIIKTLVEHDDLEHMSLFAPFI